MFPGSPHGFVIVKNLKRNCQDTNLTRGPKGIFYPVAWEATNPKEGSWLPTHLYVCARPFSFSRSNTSEGSFRALTTRDLQCLLQLECHAVAIKPQSYPW